MLDARTVKMVDFMCGEELKQAGLEPVTDYSDRWPEPDILEFIIEDTKRCRKYCNWRSDLDDPQQDYGFELFRRALLSAPEQWVDSDLVRRSFLFEDVFVQLRKNLKHGVETIV